VIDVMKKKEAGARPKKPQKAVETFTDLTIHIEHHDVRIGAAVTSDAG